MIILKTTTSNFGREIKKRLIDLGMTQRELALKVGMHEGSLTAVVNGRRSGSRYKDSILKVLYQDEKKGD